MNRIARKQIITLLFCFGWAGCAGQPPMASDGVIVAGFDAQNHGIAGYRIAITADTSVMLLDAKRKPLGRLVVVGSADTAGTGTVVRFQLDQQDLTKHIQLANGTYSVSDDATSYINAIGVSADDAFGAVLADRALAPALAQHQLSFVGRPSDVAYDACNPEPTGEYSSPCGAVGYSYCYQWQGNCQTAYDTCSAEYYDYCCSDPFYQWSYDCAPYVCGGPYPYDYQCNPHQVNCHTYQEVTYDLTFCTCTYRYFDRQCGLPARSCQPSPGTCQAPCSAMATGNNVGPLGCCIYYDGEYLSCIGPDDPGGRGPIDVMYAVP